MLQHDGAYGSMQVIAGDLEKLSNGICGRSAQEEMGAGRLNIGLTINRLPFGVRTKGMLHQERYAGIIVERRQRKAEKATVMVFVIHLHVLAIGAGNVYGILVTCKQVDELFGSRSKEQQEGQASR